MCVCVFVRAVVYVFVCLLVCSCRLFACNPRQLGRAKSGEKPTSISFLGLSERCQYLHSGDGSFAAHCGASQRIGKQTAEEEYPLPYCRMRATEAYI